MPACIRACNSSQQAGVSLKEAKTHLSLYKHRSFKGALLIAAAGYLVVVLLGAIDALIAINHMNPVPSAKSAVEGAGWQMDSMHLRTVSYSTGPVGSSAVVRYGLGDPEHSDHLEVRLRRPLLSSQWEVVSIQAR